VNPVLLPSLSFFHACTHWLRFKRLGVRFEAFKAIVRHARRVKPKNAPGVVVGGPVSCVTMRMSIYFGRKKADSYEPAFFQNLGCLSNCGRGDKHLHSRNRTEVSFQGANSTLQPPLRKWLFVKSNPCVTICRLFEPGRQWSGW